METPDDSPDERYLVPALDRGLRILALFTAERPQWSPGDIARATGLTRSTCFRLLHTLVVNNYLVRAGLRDLRLGPAVLALAHGFTSGHDLIGLARPLLEKLRDETGASAHLGILAGTEVLYLLRAASRQPVVSNLAAGSRLPAAITAMGRLLLAEQDEAVRLAAWTAAAGPGTWDEFRARLAADRQAGFVAGPSGYERGLLTIAAPVRDAAGGVVAAINVSSPRALTAPESVEPMRLAVIRAAAEISAGLGFIA